MLPLGLDAQTFLQAHKEKEILLKKMPFFASKRQNFRVGLMAQDVSYESLLPVSGTKIGAAFAPKK
jgi:hypothetical protein